MDKCPYCGAETRPGDNFCLNCGNRLTPATSSPASMQAQPGIGDATVAAPGDWASAAGWSDGEAGATIAASEPQAYHVEAAAPTAQATMDRIEHPARLTLRSENSQELQEFLLDKPEITIGRAPTSDVLLSKDKLTSRRHATVRHENGDYVLQDERSANGTYVNGQQLEEMMPKALHDGDLIGIGEHELVFHEYAASSPVPTDVEDMPTMRFDPSAELPQHQDDQTVLASGDDFSTHTMGPGETMAASPAPSSQMPAQSQNAPAPATSDSTMAASAPSLPEPTPAIPVPTSYSGSPTSNFPEPVADAPASVSPAATGAPVSGPPAATSAPVPGSAPVTTNAPATSPGADTGVTFNRLSNLPQPSLPDLAALMAAMSTLDGQVMSLQEQFKGTQEAMRGREAEVTRTASQLRSNVRRVVERMDNTIADVARSRESLAWADLIQLMEDVMSNPRDIEYVTRLARRARELNKVFQIHQSVLNAMAECNSLLRGLVGEDM